MQRRKFVKASLTRLPFIWTLPALLAACSKVEEEAKPNGKSVIIVGAGISGLAAAKKLKQKGFNIIVLEAQDTPGGRIRTDCSSGIPFDAGASWIHRPNGNPVTDLAAQSGATTFLTNDESITVFDVTGRAYSDKEITDSENLFDAALIAVERAGSSSQSFESVFNSLYPAQAGNRLWKYMLSAYLEFDTGSDISTLSSKYFYDDEEFRGSDEIITNGYDKITDFLAQGLDIRLNTKVSGIDYTDSRVKVSANGKVFEGDYVVVSVPLGVLKSNGITFSPALPAEKSEAIAKTNMGNVNKFLLLWKTAFWDTNLQYIGYSPETKGKFNYFMNMKKFTPANGLMTFALGNFADLTERMSDNEIIEEIMLHLKSIYGNGIPLPTNMLRTRWRQNVHSFGAYSYATNGTTTEVFDMLANAVSNRVFFAGEHTNRAYRGTVHGAYLSGLREADKIIDL